MEQPHEKTVTHRPGPGFPGLMAQTYVNIGLGTLEFDHEEDVRFSDGTELTPRTAVTGAYQITPWASGLINLVWN